MHTVLLYQHLLVVSMVEGGIFVLFQLIYMLFRIFACFSSKKQKSPANCRGLFKKIFTEQVQNIQVDLHVLHFS